MIALATGTISEGFTRLYFWTGLPKLSCSARRASKQADLSCLGIEAGFDVIWVSRMHHYSHYTRKNTGWKPCKHTQNQETREEGRLVAPPSIGRGMRKQCRSWYPFCSTIQVWTLLDRYDVASHGYGRPEEIIFTEKTWKRQDTSNIEHVIPHSNKLP